VSEVVPAAEERPPVGRPTRRDWRIITALTVVAFLLRLLSPILPDFATNPLAWPPVRVLGLGHPYQSPNGYIFDEVYFAQDACKDLLGKDYLDPEPPLSKLVIAAGMVVAGTWMHYDQGAHVAKDKQCETQGTLPGFGTWGWRLAPLIFGTLLIPLIYLIALRLWPDRFFATSAALLMNFDGMAFVQSRIAMIDVVAIGFLLAVYLSYLWHRDAADERAWTRTALWLGVAIGLGVAAKWVTLAAWGTILVFIVGGFVLRWVSVSTENGWSWGGAARAVRGPSAGRRFLTYLLVLVAIPVVIYLGSYFRYVSYPHCIPVSGKPCYQTTPALNLAKVGPVWLPTGVNPGNWLNQVWLHDKWSYEYHRDLTATHTYGSEWYSWPFLLRPVAYYYEDNQGLSSIDGSPLREEVFNLGNPAIWWFSIPCLIYCGIYAVRRRSYPAALIVVGFLAAWLPFAGVKRVMFLYHMFGALPFMILAVAFALARMRTFALRIGVGPSRLPAIRGSHLALAYLGVVIVMFGYFYPLWTGAPLTGPAWNDRIWFSPDPSRPYLLDLKISWV